MSFCLLVLHARQTHDDTTALGGICICMELSQVFGELRTVRQRIRCFWTKQSQHQIAFVYIFVGFPFFDLAELSVLEAIVRYSHSTKAETTPDYFLERFATEVSFYLFNLVLAAESIRIYFMFE